ncbi:sugar carrier protein C isoform X1 [Cinnamomum micranthum f. kanehirae]|uniref:Sugar carrier protein C isoform X1 n=1 Tax=Cinnamomum micranthum f. kanehirae TaxID=337451 RepID=A0A3S3P0G9_9MAGN|nr:sugar carrier protein C isoform X1 [Cinnamomum micranthum f. kanehirae]
MAGGIISSNNAKEYPGKVTAFMRLSGIMAAACGLMFGYDIGISGGVTSMDVFLKKFFLSVYMKKQAASSNQNNYCKFDSQLLTLFTSSLYITGLIGSIVASYASRRFGRKATMLSGGAVYLVGAAVNGAAYAVWMLILGRLLLGAGIGLVIQAAPMFLSEIALPQKRGIWNSGFQLMITIGILVANLVNYGTGKMKGDIGWRLSLGLAAVPGIIVFVGTFFLPETPNSLIERGDEGKALTMLKKIRGVEDVNEEFADLLEASEASKKVKNPWRAIVTRKYRPQFLITLLIPFFQQLTGINVVMFYAPVLFQTLGFKNDASLMSAVITGLVNVLATFVAFFFVDRFGRRVLFFEGGFQMLISQVAIGFVLLAKFGTKGVATLSSGWAVLVVVLICTYTAAFAWSWGPLGWLLPSEIFQLEIRSAGVAINASVNLFMTFVVAQAFLPALCHVKFGLFFIFACILIIMTSFVYYFLPETRNIPIEDVPKIFNKHWFWKRYASNEEEEERGRNTT